MQRQAIGDVSNFIAYMNQCLHEKAASIAEQKKQVEELQKWRSDNECPICNENCAIRSQCCNQLCNVRQCEGCLEQELKQGKCSFCRQPLADKDTGP